METLVTTVCGIMKYTLTIGVTFASVDAIIFRQIGGISQGLWNGYSTRWILKGFMANALKPSRFTGAYHATGLPALFHGGIWI